MQYLFLSLFLFGLSLTPFYGQNAAIESLEKEIQLLEEKKINILSQLEKEKLKQLRADLQATGLPKLAVGEELVNHEAMSLVYSEKHEQAKWVAHIITPDVINGKEGRSNDFRPDPLIKTGSSVEEDYFLKFLQPDSSYKYDGFGYDRGHLAPSADFRWSAIALSESYFYSNMSPQAPDFNRESWADLEDLLRGYIINNPSTQLYVVTGPILNDTLKRIERGVNKVSIPEQYFKVAIDLENKRGIGFIMPNKKVYYPISSFAKSIDEIEAITGYDFYAKLSPELEKKLEKTYSMNDWLPSKNATDVEPIKPQLLPKNHFNSVQAKIYVGDSEKISVCGTIVSAKTTRNGHLFMNVDKGYPNQLLTIAVWKKNYPNFSYDVAKRWEGKRIKVTGNVVDFGGVPTIILEKESEIEAF